MNINAILTLFFILSLAIAVKLVSGVIGHRLRVATFKNHLLIDPQFFFKAFCQKVDQQHRLVDDGGCQLSILFNHRNDWRPVCAHLSSGRQLRERYYVFRSKCSIFPEEQSLFFADCY